MSETILPCAVCGGEAQSTSVFNGEVEAYAVRHLSKCAIDGIVSGIFHPNAVPTWNTLMKYIADGRAVEWLREKAWTGIANVPDHDNPEQWDVFDAMSGDSLGNAPTLAEAVRKAQGDE